MAKFKARKEKLVKTNNVLCALITFAVVVISIISIFSESLSTISPNKVRSSQSIKLIEQIDSMSALLKEGDELYIKESNGKVRKIDEVISLEDGIKIPKSIFDEFGKVNTIKLKQHGNNIKAKVNFKEINKELMNCLSNQTDPTLCKLNNFTVENLNNSFIPIIPITNNGPLGNYQGCQKPPIPKNILFDVQRLAKENGGFIDSKTIENELRGITKPPKKLEPKELPV
jgi:hypothetical protein